MLKLMFELFIEVVPPLDGTRSIQMLQLFLSLSSSLDSLSSGSAYLELGLRRPGQQFLNKFLRSLAKFSRNIRASFEFSFALFRF